MRERDIWLSHVKVDMKVAPAGSQRHAGGRSKKAHRAPKSGEIGASSVSVPNKVNGMFGCMNLDPGMKGIKTSCRHQQPFVGIA